MQFIETKLSGVFLVNLDKFEDNRGFFTRMFDKKIFQDSNLNSEIVQCNFSKTNFIGTIRGFHYQTYPFEETKLIRCTQGKIFDVVIDIRPNSPTYKQWDSFELDSKKHTQLYIPEGVAHGFQSLENNSEVFYQVSQYYHPECEKGIRWNDPTFNVSWAIPLTNLSQKDKSWPDFSKN
jgi:dTDP-4-dehydrorhamnose 3,5-epimerase